MQTQETVDIFDRLVLFLAKLESIDMDYYTYMNSAEDYYTSEQITEYHDRISK